MQFIRWQRFGHDRLYVHDDLGVDLGYWDVATGRTHPKDAAAEPWLAQAIANWRSGATSGGTTDSPSVIPPAPRGPDFAAPPVASLLRADRDEPEPRGKSPGPVVADLIFNAPGQQLNGQIAAARLAGQRPTLMRRLLYGKRAYSTWERGAIGEWLVAEELKKLVHQDYRWGFLNSIPVGDNGADIDHVAIGPAGVFTINSKHHGGSNIWVAGNTFMVNGTRQPYIRNSRHEAQRAARLLFRACGLPVQVTGVVVPVNARDVTIKEQPDGVHVVNRMGLAQHLMTSPMVLSREQIERLYDHARLESTWMSPRKV